MFATVEIMRRINRPLLKLLDFKFSEFPCIVALKYDSSTHRIIFQKLSTNDLHSVMYSFGFKQKVGDTLKLINARQTSQIQSVEIFKALELDTRLSTTIDSLLLVFPQLRSSIHSYVKTQTGPEYTLKLF